MARPESRIVMPLSHDELSVMYAALNERQRRLDALAKAFEEEARTNATKRYLFEKCIEEIMKATNLRRRVSEALGKTRPLH